MVIAGKAPAWHMEELHIQTELASCDDARWERVQDCYGFYLYLRYPEDIARHHANTYWKGLSNTLEEGIAPL